MESLPVDKNQQSLHIPYKQTQLVSHGIKTGNHSIKPPYVDATKTTTAKTADDVKSRTFDADCSEESHVVKPVQKDSGNTSICRLCCMIFDSEHSLSLHREQVHSDVIFMQTGTKISVPHPVTSTILEQDAKVLQENQAATKDSLEKRPVTDQSSDSSDVCPVTSSSKEVDLDIMSTASSHEFDPDQDDLDDDIIEIDLWPVAPISQLENGSKMDFEIVSTASSSDLETNHNEINADVELSDTETYESDWNSGTCISNDENELKGVETNVQQCKQGQNSIHKQNKMFQCDSCNKRFLQKITLKNHEKVCKMATRNKQQKLNGVRVPELDESSKLNKYKCPSCRKTYRVLQDLRKHQEMCFAKEENNISSKNTSPTKKLIWKKTYMCVMCKKVYNNYGALWGHNKVHHSGNPEFSKFIKEKCFVREEEQITAEKNAGKGNKYGCHKCNKWYRFPQGLHKHKKTHHSGEAALQKSLAEDPEATTEKSLTMKRSQEKPSYVCELCQKSYSSKQGLQYHYDTHFQNEQHTCKQCNKTYTQQHELQHHMKRHHARKEPDLIKTHSSRLVGQNRKSQVIPMPCDACDKVLYSAKSLQMHKYQAHRRHSNRKGLECNHCDRKFKEKRVLDLHIYSAHKNSLNRKKLGNVCCDKKFPTTTHLKAHILRVHSNDEQKLAKRMGKHCLPCGRKFSTRRGLNLHNNHVHGGNIRKEQENVGCNKRITSKISLQKHALSVNSGKRHTEIISKSKNENICCGRKFSTKLGLRMHHYQGHYDGYRENDKDNICCGRKFSTKLGLQMHFVKVHSKHERNKTRKVKDQIGNIKRSKKENICCGKKFSTNAGLRMHNSWAHSNAVNGNDMKCLQCDRIFSNKRGLILHNYFKHKGTASSERNLKNTRQTKLMQDETDKLERAVSCRICNHTFGTGEELHKHFRTSSCALGSMARFSIDKSNKESDHNNTVCELQGLPQSDSSNFEPELSTCYSGNKYESSDEEGNFQCGLCLLCFPDDIGLLSHMEGVHRIHEPYTKESLCGNAGEEVKNSSENCKTPVEGMFAIQESFLCGICNETFHNEFALDSHMNFHLQHEYLCGQCSQLFPSSEDLVSHVLTSHQDKSIESTGTKEKFSEHDETSTNKEEIPEPSSDNFVIEIDEDEHSSEINRHTLYETEDISNDNENLKDSEQEPDICEVTVKESSMETICSIETISLNTSLTEINETNEDDGTISAHNSDVDDDISDEEIVVILEDEEEEAVTTMNHTQTSSDIDELPEIGTTENMKKSVTNKLNEEKKTEMKKAAINVNKTTISYASEQTDLIMEVETVLNDRIVQPSSQGTNILEAVTPEKRPEVNARRNKQESLEKEEVAVDGEKTTTSYFNDEVIIIEDDTKTNNRKVQESSKVIDKLQTKTINKLQANTTENNSSSNSSRNKLDEVKYHQKDAAIDVEKTKTSYFNNEVIIIDEETKAIDRNSQPNSGEINKLSTNSENMSENGAGQNKPGEVNRTDVMKPLIGVVKSNIFSSVKYHPGLRRFVLLYPAKENTTTPASASVKQLPISDSNIIKKDQLSTHITRISHLVNSVVSPTLPVDGNQITTNAVQSKLCIDSSDISDSSQIVNNTAESTLSTDSSQTDNSKPASSCDKSPTEKSLTVTTTANDNDNVVNNNKPVNIMSKLLAYKPKFI